MPDAAPGLTFGAPSATVAHVLKKKEMDFSLTKIDLTLRPQLSASKMIRSVPVVEVGNERLIGNATTQQLAELIGRAQASMQSSAH